MNVKKLKIVPVYSAQWVIIIIITISITVIEVFIWFSLLFIMVTYSNRFSKLHHLCMSEIYPVWSWFLQLTARLYSSIFALFIIDVLGIVFFLCNWVSLGACGCVWSLHSFVNFVILTLFDELESCPHLFVPWDTFYNINPYVKGL